MCLTSLGSYEEFACIAHADPNAVDTNAAAVEPPVTNPDPDSQQKRVPEQDSESRYILLLAWYVENGVLYVENGVV